MVVVCVPPKTFRSSFCHWFLQSSKVQHLSQGLKLVHFPWLVFLYLAATMSSCCHEGILVWFKNSWISRTATQFVLCRIIFLVWFSALLINSAAHLIGVTCIVWLTFSVKGLKFLSCGHYAKWMPLIRHQYNTSALLKNWCSSIIWLPNTMKATLIPRCILHCSGY